MFVPREIIDSAVGSAGSFVPRKHTPWHCGVLLACLYLILKFPNFSRMKAFYALCVIKSVIVFLANRASQVRMRLPKGKSRSVGSLYAILTPRRQRLFAKHDRATTNEAFQEREHSTMENRKSIKREFWQTSCAGKLRQRWGRLWLLASAPEAFVELASYCWRSAKRVLCYICIRKLSSALEIRKKTRHKKWI